MIPFEKEFFLEEQRDDFLIESRVKHIWAAEMEVLYAIDQICVNHGLRWFAYAGTLLGSARHKGFIPWDDDMDICMLRSDYNKFIHFAQTELPPGYQILSPYTDNDWDQAFSLVRNSDTISISPERLAAFHGCPYVVGVDIFPLDAIPPEPEASALSSLHSVFCYYSGQTKTHMQEVMDALPELEKICNTKFDPSHNLKNQLLRAADKVCQCYDISECNEVARYPYYDIKHISFPKEWFAETVLLPYENIGVYAPKEYDKFLTALYGDWRTPVREEGHKIFQEQAEMLRDALRSKIANHINQK